MCVPIISICILVCKESKVISDWLLLKSTKTEFGCYPIKCHVAYSAKTTYIVSARKNDHPDNSLLAIDDVVSPHFLQSDKPDISMIRPDNSLLAISMN